MTIQTRHIDYDHGGTALRGHLAWDGSNAGERPVVAVCHAWAGRSPFENGKAQALAKLGYAGFAIDVYGAGVLGTSKDENSSYMNPLLEDRALLQARLAAGIAAAREQDVADASRVAAIGFCFGGLCVLDLARTGMDLRGVVSFHGLFAAPGNTAGNTIRAKVLALHGWDDPMSQPDSVLALAQELTAGGADWQLHAYGNTLHAFTNPEANDRAFGTVYDAAADRRSWAAMQGFLAETLA